MRQRHHPTAPVQARRLAASYAGRGLVCHHARSGEVAWRRADLTRLQRVAFSTDGRRLYCTSDEGPCLVLDAGTGAEIGRLRGVRGVWEGPFAPVLLVDGAGPEILTAEGRKLASIDRTTFAILDAAFSTESLCLSESGGPVRCFRFDGTELWKYGPRPGRHVVALVYAAAAGRYLAVEWPFEHGGPKSLIALDPATGRRATIASLGEDPEMSFAQRGSRLVTAGGRVVETSSGATIASLGFAEHLGARPPRC